MTKFKPQDMMSELGRELDARFKAAENYESKARRRYLNDVKFGNGDSTNNWQWDSAVLRQRQSPGASKPTLTINKTRQHCLNIINDAKQNKPGIALKATGGGATFRSAQIYGAIIRRIEYQSKASAAYDCATVSQVFGGMGFWRIDTAYADNDSFDQEIFIKRVENPLSIYLDHNAMEADKSDANWGIIFEDLEHGFFKVKYPQFVDYINNAGVSMLNSWMNKDTVRTAEYFRRVYTKRTLYLVPQLDGTWLNFSSKDIAKEVTKGWDEREDVKSREYFDITVEKYFIVGNTIVEKSDWAGKYIPIVMIVGEEYVINGELDRKGQVRNLLDPARMYNYWSSAAVEYGALQTKVPWMASSRAIEGHQDVWARLNTTNPAYIPYNDIDDEGQLIPPPQRVDPPVSVPLALQGMQVASQEMSAASGQYEASFGAPGNERSLPVLSARQRAGDKSTYHFIDNQAIGIRYTGIILMDLIPKIYDTERVIMILGEDGATEELSLQPNAQDPYTEKRDKETEIVLQRMFNVNIGQYQVEVDVGPAYATRRQEAFEAFKLILTQSPHLTSIIGDILFRAGDFPHADEAAERLKRMVPPEALGLGPTVIEKQQTEQLQQLQQALTTISNDFEKAKIRLKSRAEHRNIDAYQALTARLKVLASSNVDAVKFRDAIQGLIIDLSNDTLDPVQAETEKDFLNV